MATLEPSELQLAAGAAAREVSTEPHMTPTEESTTDATTTTAHHTKNSMPPVLLPMSRISVAIDPVALITTECIIITTAMRKNARWAQSSVSAILGGNPGYSSSGLENQVPGSPGGMRARGRVGMDLAELGLEGGLAGRWGLGGKKGKRLQDNPLLAAFARLRSDLQDCKDIRTFDTLALLHPFLQIVRSSSTSGPITGLAVSSITKFFSYNLITIDSPRLSLSLQLLASTINHCRFEGSDTAQDEVVLIRILKLMELLISGPGGDLLSDESVAAMMETGLSMCCQMQLSEMLRRSAEMTLVTMCQVVFERLKRLEIEAGEVGEELEEASEDMESVKMEPSLNGESDTVTMPPPSPGRSSDSSEKKSDERSTAFVAPTGANGSGAATDSENIEDMDVRPYSLPSMRELLRVLIDLMDPDKARQTDTMRVVAMRIIDVAFEVAGPSIAKHPSMAGLAKDDLCRCLFQHVRSDTMSILQESLRVTGTLLATTRSVLKLQQELFLSYMVACLHPRIEIPREPGIDPILYDGVPQAPKLTKQMPNSLQSNSGRSTPVSVKERQKLGLEGGTRRPDAREAMVECVCALTRIPSYMVELYVNYDCEVDRSDLCEDVIGFLSRNAFPDSATWSTTNVPPLCLDALLGYINHISDRLDEPPQKEGFPDPNKLLEQRARKQIIIKGAAEFNDDPKKAILYLVQNGIIDSIDNPQSISNFLKGTSRIPKKQLGEYISKKQNGAILNAFMDTFDFTGKRVDEALRDMLNTFRLPGESQLIERIINEFSEKYCAMNEVSEDVADKDAVYILTYAIIMLNTDQHNPNVKAANRMKYEDFARNLRGVNGGNNFPPEYLQAIFDTIKNNEIILPDEHDNKHAFDYAWKELLLKTSEAGDLVVCDTNIFDAHMFSATWRPVVATLSYVFMSATDEAVFLRVGTGFEQCASIAARYGLTDAMDHIVKCLSIMSTLATEAPPSTALNTEIQVEGNSVMVSEMAVKFGRDWKAQLAAVILFRIVTGNEKVLNKGWHQIVRSWLNLFVNSLIPPFFSPAQSGLDIPPIPLQTPSVVIDRNQTSKDTGLLSAFTNYITSYASDDPPEPSDEELERTLCTVDWINAWHLGEIFANIMQLESTKLEPLVDALLSQLPDTDEDNSFLVINKPDYPSPVNGTGPIQKGPTYDAAVVYILEFTTCLILRDEGTVAKLGKGLAETLTGVIRNSSKAHHITVSRAIYYLFCLLNASHEHSFLNVPVVLHSIATLDKKLLDKSALPVLKGLSKCVRGSSRLKNEMINSPDFWVLLRKLLPNEDACADVFGVLGFIVSGSPSDVTSDNYVAVASLLNDFATAGGVGSLFEQKQDKLVKRGKAKNLTDRPDKATVERGSKAVLMVYQLTTRVPTLITQSHLEKNEAWTTYWSPIFQCLSGQCINPCREIRTQAFNSLQRSLLSPELTSHDHHEWTAIFGDVLFPLITRLLKPEVFQSDPRGMGETRVQAATLLCKIFLHYLVMLSEWEGMLDLWLKILDIMDRLMNSGQGDHLEEAVPESLKNILLVMSSGGYLVPPVNPGEGDAKYEELWNQTWKRLERFLPNLKAELFPNPPVTPKTKSEEDASLSPNATTEGQNIPAAVSLASG